MDSFKDLNDKVDAQEMREAELTANILDQEKLISAYKLAEERGAVLAAIVNSSDDAIISKDLDSIVTSWNLSAERIFGYTAEEMIGESILKLIPVDRVEEEPQILLRLGRRERIDHFQTKRITKYGVLIDVSLTISPVLNDSGNIIGVSKIARDITSVKISEERSAILSAIIASTDDAIISKDLNSIITSWNPSAAHIFGYTAEEMIGESILMLIPEDRKEEEALILGKLLSGDRVDHFETKRVTKSGKLIDVSLTISPVLDKAGHIIGLSKIARDITYKKQEEQRKNDFIAIISHELKTPLTSMKSYVQLALIKARDQADSFSEKVLVRAEAQTQKMITMIHDFLNLSRLEEGKMSLSRSKFSLSEFMEDVISESLILAPAHILNFSNCGELELFADKDKLAQVMTNLLSNAVKYSALGSEINIFCVINQDTVELGVADQGVGISQEDQQYLFERFYRVKNEQLPHVSGFGIGLYLVAEILKLHGSKIHLKSEIGKGSVFSFTLAI